MKTIRIAAVALLVLAAAALAGVGRPEAAGGAEPDARAGITVTGLGTVKSVPDEAEVSLGVETQGATAKEALAENSARVERLLAALRGAGVAKGDIRTQEFSVYPRYETDGQSSSGYSARNSVSVKIRDLDRAGAILELAARAGANQTYGPMMSSSDREELQQKALAAAVRNARDKAEALAKAAGVGLGRVTAITEGYGGPQPLMYAADVRAKAAEARPVPIEPGTEDVQATVTVTFSIE
jgi:uncharacterized protein YggE